MDIQVSHSATVRYYDQASISLYTYFYGGHWMWFGALSNVVGHDDLGCKIFETAGEVDCGTMFFDSSEDAIVHAVAQFDGTEEDDMPLCKNQSCGNRVDTPSAWYCDICNGSVDGTYYGEVDPTGWDARDHKALYE